MELLFLLLLLLLLLLYTAYCIPPLLTDEYGAFIAMILTIKTELLGEKRVLLPVWPPEIL
jgi:hypothetical protein